MKLSDNNKVLDLRPFIQKKYEERMEKHIKRLEKMIERAKQRRNTTKGERQW